MIILILRLLLIILLILILILIKILILTLLLLLILMAIQILILLIIMVIVRHPSMLITMSALPASRRAPLARGQQKKRAASEVIIIVINIIHYPTTDYQTWRDQICDVLIAFVKFTNFSQSNKVKDRTYYELNWQTNTNP